MRCVTSATLRSHLQTLKSMPKRTVTELQQPVGSSKVHAAGDGNKPELPSRTDALEEAMGEFEDPWEDEEESDEEVIDGNEEDDPNGIVI